MMNSVNPLGEAKKILWVPYPARGIHIMYMYSCSLLLRAKGIGISYRCNAWNVTNAEPPMEI